MNDLSLLAWAIMGVNCLIFYGGLAYCLTVAMKKKK